VRIVALALVLLLVVALGACGGSSHAVRSTRAPGQIEKLREQQEAAQAKLEAEGRRRAREVERERAATRREAEREAG
jgi:uncharacterized protein HemX